MLLGVTKLINAKYSINFCMTQNVPLTNGKQVQEGSCNPTPVSFIFCHWLLNGQLTYSFC